MIGRQFVLFKHPPDKYFPTDANRHNFTRLIGESLPAVFTIENQFTKDGLFCYGCWCKKGITLSAIFIDSIENYEHFDWLTL